MSRTIADPPRPRNDRAVVPVVGAAILRPRSDGGLECLVTRRAPHVKSAGLWEFPGGKVEAGETPRAALTRELREELAIGVEVGLFLGRGIADVGERTIVLDVYETTWTAGDLCLVDHDECRWIDAATIDELEWAAADVPILGALTRRLNGATSQSA